MSSYRILFASTVETVVIVDINDNDIDTNDRYYLVDTLIELAYDGVPHEFCSTCTGLTIGSTWTRNVDELEPIEVTTARGEVLWSIDEPQRRRHGDTA